MIIRLLPLLGLTILWAAATAMLWRTRRWLIFYITGAFGFILLVVYGASMLGLDKMLESFEASQVSAMGALIGVRLSVLGGSGLAIPGHTGWAVFDIGVECSAILEMSAIIGLVVFYPAFSPRRRAAAAAFGLVATYVINLFRVLLIVALINAFGTSWVFPAHAVFGRMFFFAGTVALYWYLVTRPTIGVVRDQLRARAEASDE
jgi:exosortase family protein XrtG